MDKTNSPGFVDRRQGGNRSEGGPERRQFGGSSNSPDPEVREFSQAIDAYKISNQRRYLTLEEVLLVVKSIGYHK